MDNISSSQIVFNIDKLIVDFNKISLTSNGKSKFFTYLGKDYILDYDRKPLSPSYKITFDINTLRDIGCNRQVGACKKYECKNCYNRRFISNPRCVYWSTDNNKDPIDVTIGETKKYWFNCDKCTHKFESDPGHIKAGRFCPYCCISSKKLCEDLTCSSCYERSFMSHERSIEWDHVLNTKHPRFVFKNCSTKYNFICRYCNHNLHMTPNSIINLGSTCKYCTHQDLCDNDACKQCFDISLLSSNMTKYFSVENNVNPRKIFKKSSTIKYKWNCNICLSEFEMDPNAVSRGYWCQHCKNKTENKLYNILSKIYKVERQYKPDWVKNYETCSYPSFDFIIPELKLIIELDGKQHFEQVSNWTDPEITQYRDVYKMVCAINNGYSLIRVLQEDVWNDKNNWQTKLLNNIKYYKDSNITFIDNNNIYNEHIFQLLTKGIKESQLIII